MTVLTEGRHAGEFILSEAEGALSREQITVSSGRNLPAGTILEASGGEYVGFTGSTAAVAAGVLLAAADATDADVKAVMICRNAEVNRHMLSVPTDNTAQDKLTAGIASLAAIDVIAR